MATIKSQMTLNDGMSGVLKKITRALDLTLTSFEQVQRASSSAMNVAEIEAARGALVEASSAVDEMAENYRRAAQEEEKLNQNIKQGTSAMDGLLGKVTAVAAAYASIGKIKSFAEDTLGAADVQIGAQVQLKTVMGNMGSLDYYDQVLDRASAIQGKGIYGDEAMIAGAGELATYFSDGEAILSMMDTLSNYAMGMSGGGTLDTTAVVDYATGIGKIMTGSYDAMTKKGFEFTDVQKAIIEGSANEAQIVAELGAEYLNMSADMQAAAVIGSVIDENWAGLYETMSNTPEGKLIQMNNTLGDIKENVGAGIYPAVLNFVSMVQSNLPQVESAAMGLATMFGFIITMLTGMAEGAISFGTAVADNWGWISPIVMGVVTALLAYHGAMLAINNVEAVSNGLKALSAARSAIKAGATLADAAATTTATGAQVGLNTALLACPITWIVAGVIAFVAGLVALCNWISTTTGVAQTGFGVITGCINVAVQAVVNAGMVVANIFLGIWNAAGAVCSNMGTAFHNVIANVQGWFYDLLATGLTVVEGICAALNKLPFVEFDYSGIADKADEYAAKSAAAYGRTEEFTSVADAFNEGFGTFNTFSEGWASEAFHAEAAWGDGMVDKVGGFFDGFGYEPETMDDLMEKYGNIPGGPLNDLGNDVGAIADNTGGMADALEISGEELKYLRDIAERDAINRFTTAEVKIDMTGMQNRIDGSMDLDGVIRELTDGFSEALVTAAEGVHA